MRKAFVNTLIDLASHDPRIILLAGDLGFMILEPFVKQLPERFFNVGVAEQNLVGIATGLAEAGFIPFVYSISNFAVLRPYEFIRNGPVMHQFQVRIVGIGGGIEYSNNGVTHWGLEDMGVLRVLPGIQIIAPADSGQTRTAIMSTWDLCGPVYYRLGKDDSIVIPGLEGRFEIDHLQVVRKGGDILFLTIGSITTEVIAAANKLALHHIEACIGVVSSLNPAPVEDIKNLLASFKLVISVEAHFINGGLGSLIAEVIAENQLGTNLVRCGVNALPDGITGSQKYLYEKYGIDQSSLEKIALSRLQDC
jgi:transketolase